MIEKAGTYRPACVLSASLRLQTLHSPVRHHLRHLHQMHHRPLLHIHGRPRRVRTAHRAMQQIRRMGQGIFEAQVVI